MPGGPAPATGDEEKAHAGYGLAHSGKDTDQGIARAGPADEGRSGRDRGAGRLTIAACTGTGDQVVKKEGPYVMDLRAFSTANGNAVLAYPQNGGKNQQWSLP